MHGQSYRERPDAFHQRPVFAMVVHVLIPFWVVALADLLDWSLEAPNTEALTV
jgi:hypothetical protein